MLDPPFRAWRRGCSVESLPRQLGPQPKQRTMKQTTNPAQDTDQQPNPSSKERRNRRFGPGPWRGPLRLVPRLKSSIADLPAPRRRLEVSGFNLDGGMECTAVGWLEWPPVHVPHEHGLGMRVIDDGQSFLRASVRVEFQVSPRADLVQPRQRETTETEFGREQPGKRPSRSRSNGNRLASLPFLLSNPNTQKFDRTRPLA